jgi:transposase
MAETLTITTERVDDLPLLLTHLMRMDLPRLIDSYFRQHGNWQGLPAAWVATVWLAHLLSQADHRLNHVQPWAEQRLHTLQALLPLPIQPLDLTDDRLASVLRMLSDDAAWIGFERALTRTTLRVYDLRPSRVRVDTTTSSGYWHVTDDGLFQFGHSKDHRPDLPQLKVLLATLDPLGMPLAMDVLSGERADDPLYLPAIARVRSTLDTPGLLYVGDCKMSSLATRAGLAFHHDFYLCPLSALQAPPEVMADYVAAVARGEVTLVPVERTETNGTIVPLADGFEVSETLAAVYDETWPVRWTERRLVVRSRQQAQTAEVALHKRLARAEQELAALPLARRGKRRWAELAELEQAAAAIVTRERVADVLDVRCWEEVVEHPVRGYGKRAATVRTTRRFGVRTEVDGEALKAAIAQLGWRVYVTNQPAEQLSLEQAVLAYREDYIVERSLGRLKGAPLSLRPLYLAREDHTTGLVRLLSIALRVLTVVEFVVRRQLAAEGALLVGVYAGQPTRATARPTTERLLATFRDVTLTIVGLPGRVVWHLTPLTAVQQRILELMGCASTIYSQLTHDSAEPP